ncbi:hypothetical protein [Elizabethkingia anophelis]|uniref:DUF3078 domain-containing protein n=1 Tax=Elizabethkingia anophelis TaxID=1117645 RepID=A0A455ZF56_9FLAO|nr:hypothetical protein [Elizabethkingia anophelis]AKH95209.1 hypothetical protein M876_11590 [Elizabethkingia anophelis FMS-007]MDV3662691.1 hypothetical protein [Elizabethkingia anophelis]OPC51632.1 hypothetical protein BAY06_04725 [Elizabethkingia anophelis]DAC75294.1 TPA_exp: hypothetical protein [Elizabethkingia anophelis]
MKTLLLTAFLTLLSLSAYCQEKFFDRFTLRKSFESKNDKAEPAAFTFTKPKDKDDSWLLNAALGYNLLANSSANLILDPYIEYHKNTLIDKIQDNWQAGVSSEWQSNDMSRSNWSPIFITAVKYNEDKVKKNTSFQGNIYFTPLFKNKGNKPAYFWIPNNTTDFGKVFQFSYSPYIGFENENRIKTENDSSSGSIYRGLFRITATLTLFPKYEKLRDKFEFNFDWQYRNNFSESVADLTKKDHKFMTAGFNYNFWVDDVRKRSAKIGIDYTKGENPTKNFEQQEFYAVSLKVKL